MPSGKLMIVGRETKNEPEKYLTMSKYLAVYGKQKKYFGTYKGRLARSKANKNYRERIILSVFDRPKWKGVSRLIF